MNASSPNPWNSRQFPLPPAASLAVFGRGCRPIAVTATEAWPGPPARPPHVEAAAVSWGRALAFSALHTSLGADPAHCLRGDAGSGRPPPTPEAGTQHISRMYVVDQCELAQSRVCPRGAEPSGPCRGWYRHSRQRGRRGRGWWTGSPGLTTGLKEARAELVASESAIDRQTHVALPVSASRVTLTESGALVTQPSLSLSHPFRLRSLSTVLDTVAWDALGTEVKPRARDQPGLSSGGPGTSGSATLCGCHRSACEAPSRVPFTPAGAWAAASTQPRRAGAQPTSVRRHAVQSLEGLSAGVRYAAALFTDARQPGLRKSKGAFVKSR